MRVHQLLLPLCIPAAAAAFSAGAVPTAPKEALARLVAENLKADAAKLSPALREEKTDAFRRLLDDLWDESRGFDGDVVAGEWTSVLSLPGDASSSGKKKRSSKRQSLVGNRVEKAGTTMGNFVEDEIRVSAPTPRENGKIEAVLRWKPSPANYSVSPDGKIVLRRIDCDNVVATLKYRWLPRVKIPFFKRTGGWLDFVYLDDDVRVTRGKRGGTFVHMRKDYLDSIMNEY